VLDMSALANAGTLLILVSSAGIRSQAQSPTPQCFALTYDSVQPGFEPAALLPQLRLLDTGSRGRADPGDTSVSWHSSYWWTSQDSIGIMISNGQFELWLRIPSVGRSRRGWAEYRNDVFRARYPRARVTARRILCNEP
jgi:hypothetical protein